jgi:hypothetical protein
MALNNQDCFSLPGPWSSIVSCTDSATDPCAKMRLIIRDNEDSASLYVANYIIERIKCFAPTPANPFVLGLPTGSSPLGVYRVLVERHKAGEV